MSIKVTFPVPSGGRNHKAIREAVLLDSYDNGYERRILAAAARAKTADQEVFVSRTFSARGRFSVWIVDTGSGNRMSRRKALQAVLARVTV